MSKPHHPTHHRDTHHERRPYPPGHNGPHGRHDHETPHSGHDVHHEAHSEHYPEYQHNTRHTKPIPLKRNTTFITVSSVLFVISMIGVILGVWAIVAYDHHHGTPLPHKDTPTIIKKYYTTDEGKLIPATPATPPPTTSVPDETLTPATIPDATLKPAVTTTSGHIKTWDMAFPVLYNDSTQVTIYLQRIGNTVTITYPDTYLKGGTSGNGYLDPEKSLESKVPLPDPFLPLKETTTLIPIHGWNYNGQFLVLKNGFLQIYCLRHQDAWNHHHGFSISYRAKDDVNEPNEQPNTSKTG